MVTVIKGVTKKFVASRELFSFFSSEDVNYDGTFYTGYPILFSTLESKTIDGLWLSPQKGILVFDIVENGPIELTERELIQDDLEVRIESMLLQYPTLRKRTKLLVPISVITFAPNSPKVVSDDLSIIQSVNDLSSFIETLNNWEHPELFNSVLSVIQSVTKLRSDSKRDYIKKTDSKGYILKSLEDTVASLDNLQEKAVVEYFEGVQRIRGLAGSGKTIILALKAAYLHSQNKDWKIAVTFNTRSLKNQFKELIERFVIEKKGEKPDWDNINIIHAWGSPKTEGIYYNICKDSGIEYYDFMNANRYRATLGDEEIPSFEVVCKKAVKEIPKHGYIKKYDLILIDEAQDLSEYFLQLCYNILKEPRRLVYAYDELQKLYEGSPLRNPLDIFNIPSYDDVMLKTCYRNSRPVLTTAHALGFGIYREPVGESLVQFFDDPKLWEDVGYVRHEGQLIANSYVTLKRTDESSPLHLERNLEADTNNIIQFIEFDDKAEQAKYISREIHKNIHEEELLHKDIIIINPESYTTKPEIGILRLFLQKYGINSHIAGDFNADIFFEKESIAFTGINRAKGNEVPMVYIINAEYCFDGSELRKKRNILFTAITRSKAWVRVCGIGSKMGELKKEFERVKSNHYMLKFIYPDSDSINKMNLINRDFTESEKKEIRTRTDSVYNLLDLVQRIKDGVDFIEYYPADVQQVVRKLL